jgi:hypothetical protein
MRYFIFKTSQCYSLNREGLFEKSDKPCEKAYWKEACLKLEGHPLKKDSEYKEGWLIDINTIDDVVNLQKEVGNIIVSDAYIEIYNDWHA